MENHERLIIVRNPNSTRAAKVGERVIGLLDARGDMYEQYHTKFADTERNIDDMQLHIPTGARVINIAGDGTAMQLVNAAVRGEKQWEIGFGPYGNFNDHAYTHADKNHTIYDLIDEKTPSVDLTPLAIKVNGEYRRHGSSYLTMGWSAIAAAQFGDENSRRAIKSTPAGFKKARSVWQLLGNYRQNSKMYLPSFAVNGVEQDHMTDIMAVNSPRVAGIIRSQDTYYDKPYFGMKSDVDVSDIVPNIPFGLKALMGHTPLERAQSMHIVFEKAAKIPMQTDGEFEWVDAEEIYVEKNPADTVRVLHPKGLTRY